MPEQELDSILRNRSPSKNDVDMVNNTTATLGVRGDLDKFDTVQSFIDRVGGDTLIHKVLIANNGIGAVKCIRSIRKWAYGIFGDERKIQFVVMATPEDMNANAEYIRMADQVVEVPNGTNNRNYANVVLIVNCAEENECDAVWAGWGHASENPALPNALEAVKSRKIVFIGPPAGPMGALGDKIGSTIIAQSASVPTISWNGDGLTANYAEQGRIPQEIYDKANVTSVQQAVETCKKVGFPLMIKASEGGGGKGIRKVLRPEDVELSFHQVQGEIPGSPIFIMKLARDARHLEVQLLADKYGEAIALSGRDCSVQRRHQKIIEEGPPLAPTPDVWMQMQAAAVRLAKEVGYVNAGTVEYLFMPDGSFAFLELNPRLQVEHPVTEMITGVNLPACQLMVAMGIPLGRIPQIRTLYGYAPFSDDVVHFQEPSVEGDESNSGALVQCNVQGHVIACRVTAENPDQGFQPTSGAIQELNFRSTRNVWGYFSVDSSGQVHEYADSQIGHLFAWGATRELARENMVQALKECSIRGEIQTTLEYLVDVLQTPAFKDYEINTAWLDKRIEGNVKVNRGNHLQLAILTAAVEAYRKHEVAYNDFVDSLQRGQIPPSSLLTLTFPLPLIYEDVKYNFETSRMSENVVVVSINGSSTEVGIRRLSDGGFLLLLGSRSHTAYAKDVAAGLRMVIDGKTCLFPKEYDPSNLRAEMAGKLTRFLVEDGMTLKAGDPYAEVEVMKMFLSLKAPEDGVIRHAMTDGAVITEGDLIARLELIDPSMVKTSESFGGCIPATWLMDPQGRAPMRGSNVKPHVAVRDLVKSTFNAVVLGYEVPRARVDAALRSLPELLNNPQLPFFEFQEALSFFSGRLPQELADLLQELLAQVEAAKDNAATLAKHTKITIEQIPADHFPGGVVPENENNFTLSFPEKGDIPPSWALIGRINSLIKEGKRLHLATLPVEDREKAAITLDATLVPLKQLCNKYRRGFRHRFFLELSDVFTHYIEVEKVYNRHNFQVEAAIQSIRAQHPDSLGNVYKVALAHARLISKNHLVLKALALIPLVMSNIVSWDGASNSSDSGVSLQGKSKSARDVALAADEQFMRMLEQLTLLDKGNEYKTVALAARQKLISSQLPSMKKLREHVVECLRDGTAQLDKSLLNTSSPRAPTKVDWLLNNHTDDLMELLLDLATAPTDADVQLYSMAKDFSSPGTSLPTSHTAGARASLQKVAMQVYAMRVYRPYGIREVTKFEGDKTIINDVSVGTSVLLRLQGNLHSGKSPKGLSKTTLQLVHSKGIGRMSSNANLSSMLSNHAVIGGTTSRGASAMRPKDSMRHMQPKNTDIAGDVDSLDIQTAVFVSVLSPQGLSKLGKIIDNMKAQSKKIMLATSSASPKRGDNVHMAGNPFAGGRTRIGMHLASMRTSSTSDRTANLALKDSPPQSVLHVLLPPAATFYDSGTVSPNISDSDVSKQLYTFVCTLANQLRSANVRRVTFVQSGSQGKNGSARTSILDARTIRPSHLFTFRNSLDFREDQLLRHIEPPMAHYLELHRLSNYSIRMLDTSNRVVRAYHAIPKPKDGRKIAGNGKKTSSFFVRVLVRRLDVRTVLRHASSETVDSPRQPHLTRDASTVVSGESTETSAVEPITTIVGVERYLLQAMNALENPVTTHSSGRAGFSSHIFLNVLGAVPISADAVASVIRSLFKRFQARLSRLRVVQVEVRMKLQKGTSGRSEKRETVTLRMVAENPTGYNLRVDAYVEQSLPQQGKTVLHSISNFTDKGILDGEDINQPYPVAQVIQQKRAFAALTAGTCYVYDFIDILETALRDNIWKGHSNPPHKVLDATELVLGDDGRLWEVSRPTGQNSIGMVAWIVKLYTPAFPPRTGGREVVIVANDITYLVGSFGTKEDLLFQKVTAYARRRGIPRLYFAANSGARIGLAKEVKACFRVAWVNPNDPTKGFKYLYVTPEDYETLSAQGSIIAERIVVDRVESIISGSGPNDSSHSDDKNMDNTNASKLNIDGDTDVIVAGGDVTKVTTSVESGRGREIAANSDGANDSTEIHYRIVSIIGKDLDLGVENLQGSGAIAGESARAYNDIFTLTYVCGRSVGIGAYLVRLNQRTIQRESMAPIILTGYAALNKLVGRRVYRSNAQLGGPGIMYTNGVTHMTVYNDLEGMTEVLRWLSFVPRSRGESLPIMETSDRASRPVLVEIPTDEAYDPRVLLDGHSSTVTTANADFNLPTPVNTPGSNNSGFAHTQSKWVAGFCDRGSFVETLGGWAKTVVTGRARLGGIPIGVIATENRTVSKTIPADPAAPESGETTTTQPGGVWFPDSAFKTAQAIRDLNAEGLPLFIFANWRGFSGGQRDMYDEVLKFGADIVEALVDYKQPVFVYLPPEAQLRGGAWVVVDSTINARVMEMYAAPTARGGVLEPAGAVSIKFRPKDVKATAHRIDKQLAWLKQLNAAVPKGSSEAEQITSQIFAREELVSTVYQQVALKFASLHDTPQRMLAKGVIHGIVPLKRARVFFFWRLKRKLREFELLKQIQKANPSLSNVDASDMLRAWFLEAHSDLNTYDVDLQRNDVDDAAHGNGGSATVTRQRGNDGVVRSFPKSGQHVLAESLWVQGDEQVIGWFERQAHAIARHIGVQRYQYIVAQVQNLGHSGAAKSQDDHYPGSENKVECGGEGAAQAVIEGVIGLVQSLPQEERGRALARLRRDIVFMDSADTSMDAPSGALRALD
jgi:biotin carboxylase/acetyl-CoA carboxylase carboxyltransferase component/biotin carboxyl carrier protein